jgi:hypothetical protein
MVPIVRHRELTGLGRDRTRWQLMHVSISDRERSPEHTRKEVIDSIRGPRFLKALGTGHVQCWPRPVHITQEVVP